MNNLKQMGIFFLGMLLISGISSCKKQDIDTPIPISPIVITDSSKKYLALGDSYTIGQSVPMQDRFSAQLAAILKVNGIALKEVEYIAQTGWTTLNLQAAINTQNPSANYDVVSLLIGVNDQYQTHDTTNYRQRFTQLLQKSIALAAGKKERVFVLSIPDYSVTPAVPASQKAQVSMEIDWFNAINKNVTLSFNIAYINITPSSREAATNPSLIANDGLHPSGLDYKKWADMLEPLMRNVLK